MAQVDPSILLNIGRGNPQFQSFAANLKSIDQVRQEKAMRPIQQQLAEIGLQQQQGALSQARQQQKLVNVAQGSAEIVPGLESGDIEGVKGTLQRRRATLIAQGLPTETTDEALLLADQNPQLLLQRAKQGVQLGNQFGVFQGGQQTSGEQNLNSQARALVGVINQETGQPFTEQSARQAIILRNQGIVARAGTSQVERAAASPELTQNIASSQGLISQAKASGSATGRGFAEASTPGGSTDLAVKRLALDETKIKNESERQDVIASKTAALAEANGAISRIDGLLLGDRFESGFGKLVTNTPDIAKSQEAIDVIAELDQIRGLVSLESRTKLKGQGTISDSESKTLEKSATVLSNPLISDGLARKELRKIKGVFEASGRRNKLAKSTREEGLIKTPAATQNAPQSQNDQALNWARNNPNDPRAAAILNKLGVQ